jgi:hypothetical protein
MREAEEDLLRLEQFLVDTAIDSGDLDFPLRAVEAIRTELSVLSGQLAISLRRGGD